MPIREFPQSSDEQEHRNWIADASIEELDEYLRHFSATPTFYRMALAQREKLHFHILRKPHWTMTPMFWIVFASFVLTLILGWKKIKSCLESLFLSVFHP